MTTPQNLNPQSTRSYHLRRESSVLKTNKKSFTRKRSNTADINDNRKSKKKINRRFDSMTDSETLHYNNNVVDNIYNIFQQFRDFIIPLQTEIKSLKQITVDLQQQIKILQHENAVNRKYNYYSICNEMREESKQKSAGVYIDYDSINYDMDLHIPNIPDSHTPNQSLTVTPNNKQSVISINPAYLFSPQSKRTRTISNATIGTHDPLLISNVISNKTDNNNMEVLEEDELEIGSKIKYNSNENVTQIYLDIDADLLSENDHMIHIPPTPETMCSAKSIEQTYNYRRNSMKSMKSMSDTITNKISPPHTPNYSNNNTCIKLKREQKYKYKDSLQRIERNNNISFI